MEDPKFDVIIFGTGLVESIAAAALSKWGFRIAHIDRDPSYGGDEASLTLDEFAHWIDSHAGRSTTRFSDATRSATVPSFARQYSICLCPTIIPSTGPFVDALVSSGVSKYSGFRLLERVAVFDSSGGFKSVPGSKEDVFKNKDISLIQKRRLMRFLTFAVGEFEESSELEGRHDLPFSEFLEIGFSLSKELATVITYALGYCGQSTEPTMSVLPRIRRYLRSVGRYGPSPFLIGHYGGIGELSQGFCRAAAVNGAVYILGKGVVSITSPFPASPGGHQQDTANPPSNSHRYTISLEDIPEPLYANSILGSTSYVPDHLSNRVWNIPNSDTFNPAYGVTSIARCIAIVETPILLHSMSREEYTEEEGEIDDSDLEDDENPKTENAAPADQALDTCVLVFPPDSLKDASIDSSAVVLITGEGTLSTPKGKYIVYISLPLTGNAQGNPTQKLQPYLDAVLKLGRDEVQEPIFTAFYMENLHDVPPPEGNISPPDEQRSWFAPSPVPLGPLGDIADIATKNAETAFRSILHVLGDDERYQQSEAQKSGIWPKATAAENDDQE